MPRGDALNRPSDFADIKEALQDRIEALARELLPDGHRNGGYWIGRNPLRDDRHAGSFWILLKRNPGVWKDEATGDTGDVINLVQYLGQLPDYRATRDWCVRWLGWKSGPQKPMSDAARRAVERQREKQRAEREASEAEELAKQSGRAFSLWLKCVKLTPDTFPGSLLETYLQSRGLDLKRWLIDAGRPLPGAIRFSASEPYVLAEGRGRTHRPCMVTLMTGANGRHQAIHRTWLSPDGSGKAAFPDPERNKARKIWPSPVGAVIRISKGEGDLTPEEAARQGRAGPLVVTEGIEDALSIAISCPDHRVWAAGTLGNIAHVPVLPCVSRVIVAADNDWHNKQASAALGRAVAALKAHGRPVAIARSTIGKDMNDLLKGEPV